MNYELEDTDDFEADFALSGPLEWDEDEDEAETDVEMSQLLSRVAAARLCA